MIKRQDLRIRDPFILTDKENGCYYMYGTTDLEEHSLSVKINGSLILKSCLFIIISTYVLFFSVEYILSYENS